MDAVNQHQGKHEQIISGKLSGEANLKKFQNRKKRKANRKPVEINNIEDNNTTLTEVEEPPKPNNYSIEPTVINSSNENFENDTESPANLQLTDNYHEIILKSPNQLT